MTSSREIHYSPAGPTVQALMDSKSFVRAIMGPIGSGKSTACVIELLARAMEQAPAPDGVRYTRFAIIRNSYPELKSTTIKTWAQWCPLHYGKINYDSPITHHVKTQEIDMEVLFLALDRDEDVKKLLSLELTGAWINEAREIPKSIVDALTGRVGRYPAKKDGGCTWSGILLDTNPPDDQSWWYKLAEEETPEGWTFFQQPSGRSDKAENLENLPEGYYRRIVAGKDPDWVKVYVDGEYGYVTEGKPVYPMFRDRIHTALGPLIAAPGLQLMIGVDFGLTPAAIIGQKFVDGRWELLDELVTDNCGVVRFAEMLAKYVAEHYPEHASTGAILGFGDPAGQARSQTDERTALDIMKEYTGWNWKPAPSNDLTMRLECVRGTLNRLIDGNPGLTISPKCSTVRKGFAGGYHYRSVKSGNGTQYHDEPAKNQFSHPHDALQYLLLGGGEHNVVMNRVNRARRGSGPKLAQGLDYDVFGGGLD